MTAALPEDPDAILAEAARWHVAIGDDAMDWDGFTTWLEADPRHAAAYDAIAQTDALVEFHAAALTETPEVAAPAAPRRWLRVVPAGLAALAASLALIVLAPHQGAPPTRSLSADAAPLAVTLADGSTAMLAPHSRMTIAANHIALDGEAHFAIRHDPSRQLTISAGPLEIADIGTTFDIATGSAVRVAVREGQVSVRAATGVVDLGAGEGVLAEAGAPLRTISAQGLGLGGWRGGSLVYDNAPIALVAEDIARATGIRLTIDPAVADRRFSGAIKISSGPRSANDFAQIVNLRLIARGDSLVLGPR